MSAVIFLMVWACAALVVALWVFQLTWCRAMDAFDLYMLRRQRARYRAQRRAQRRGEG